MENRLMAEDFLSIKDFAELVGMTIHALRLYDKKGIFHPARRGAGIESKHRYYAPTQITSVKMIRTLSEIGVPLAMIKELGQHRTPEKMIKLLSKNMDLVADEIRFLQEVHSVVSTFMELLYEGIRITETDISVSVMPEKRIILGDITDYTGADGFFREYTRFCSEPHIPKLNLSYPIGGYSETMATFMNEPSEPTRFFSLNPKGNERKPEGLYLVGYTRGYYGRMNDLPQRMWKFAKKNGLVFSGPVYSLYLNDELSMTDPEQYLVQVSASVIESRRVPSRRPHLHY